MTCEVYHPVFPMNYILSLIFPLKVIMASSSVLLPFYSWLFEDRSYRPKLSVYGQSYYNSSSRKQENMAGKCMDPTALKDGGDYNNWAHETEIWWIVTDCTYIFITRTTNKGMLQEYRDSKMEGKKLRWGVDEKVKRTVCKGLLSKLHSKRIKSLKHICNKHKQLWWISLISGKDNIQRKKMAVADLRCVSMPNYITTSKAPKVPLFYPVFWHFSFNTHYNAVMFMQILTKLGLSSSRNIGSICLNKNAL